MTGCPVLFLDVDGALSPLGDVADPGLYAAVLGSGWVAEMLYRPSVVEWLVALHQSGTVEVRWLTTWFSDAATVLAPLMGLPEFGVTRDSAEPDLARPERTWWKERQVRHFARTTGRKFVWVDDDINRYDESDDTAESGVRRWMEFDYPGVGLLLSPDRRVGITEIEMAHVDAFVNERPSRT